MLVIGGVCLVTIGLYLSKWKKIEVSYTNEFLNKVESNNLSVENVNTDIVESEIAVNNNIVNEISNNVEVVENKNIETKQEKEDTKVISTNTNIQDNAKEKNTKDDAKTDNKMKKGTITKKVKTENKTTKNTTIKKVETKNEIKEHNDTKANENKINDKKVEEIKKKGKRYVKNTNMINQIKKTIKANESESMKEYGYEIVVDSSIVDLTNQFTYTEKRVKAKVTYAFGTIRIYAQDYYKDEEFIYTECFIL